MQSRFFLKEEMLFITSIIMTIFFSIIISFIDLNLFGQVSYAKPFSLTSNQFRFKIPNININSDIESVGLTPQGIMGAPKDPINVAWYNLGPRPGETGTAVIVGHYGTWENGKISVFNNLYKISNGDKIYIENDKGITITFVVSEIRSYDKEADYSGTFESNDGKSHLKLITAEGVWDEVSKGYSKRLVIFTDREEAETYSCKTKNLLISMLPN